MAKEQDQDCPADNDQRLLSVSGLGFRGLGFRVSGLGFRVGEALGCGLRVIDLV